MPCLEIESDWNSVSAMSILKRVVKGAPILQAAYRRLNNQYARDEFVSRELKSLEAGSLILDAGCGSQRYRELCSHLRYRAQDFGQYTTDSKKILGTEGVGGVDGYRYGALDYIGDIWDIDESDGVFDAVLCTEVLEHVPYPIATVRECARLLRSGGKLILTAPSNCLRHMDPYFFYSGFSDRWYEKILNECGFKIDILEPVGDYYTWLAAEIGRVAESHSVLAKLALAPAFALLYGKKKTQQSIDTLCSGYHVVAHRL
jgi:SAM-dependent methyltransferase